MQNTDHLREVAYKDASKLNARIKFWQLYGIPRDVWFGRFFDLLEAPPNATVLELGCGPVYLWQWGLDNARVPDGWSITLTDLSAGMLDEARGNLAGYKREFGFETADVCDLRFEDASFDLVIANYMLYHAASLRTAVTEIHRVLKPTGRLFAATNSENHVTEFLDLQATHAIDESELANTGNVSAMFNLENGDDILREKFPDIEIVLDSSISRATDPQIVIDYALSMDARLDEPRLANTVREHIERNGHFAVTRSSGMFIARK